MLPSDARDQVKQFISSHAGKPLDQKAMLKPNVMMGKVLLARLMSMTPEQQQAIKSIVTPQTADALKVLLPELAGVIDKGVNNAAAG